MDGWITKDKNEYRELHGEEPLFDNRTWRAAASTCVHHGRAPTFLALVPESEWDSIGPGECKRLTLPEAFDPEGPVEVGDMVRVGAEVDAAFKIDIIDGVKIERAGPRWITGYSVRQSTIHYIRDSLTIIAKAPKPAPEPEPVKCRHCGAAPYVQTPHTIGATRYDWWQRYCVGCGQRGPKRPTEPEANEAWNAQNK